MNYDYGVLFEASDYKIFKELLPEKRISKKILSNEQEQSTNKYDDLEKLADLRDKGIIIQDEFELKKSEILGLYLQIDTQKIALSYLFCS